MSAGVLNLSIEQGTTYSQQFTGKVNDVAVNLTGYTARLKARGTNVGRSGPPALSLTSSSGITLGGAAGTITLGLSATATSNLIAGKYNYDLELESSGGVVTRLLKGTLTVVSEVTYG